MDDYDHRSVMGSRLHYEVNENGEVDEYDKIMVRSQTAPIENGPLTAHEPHSITVEDANDIDDYDHRSLQYMREHISTPLHEQKPEMVSTEGDIDDYDHRALQNPPPSTDVHSQQAVESPEGDVDDYDHRILYQTGPPPQKLQSTNVAKAAAESSDVDDYDHRSKWALGNVTTADVEEEKKARAKKAAEKLALKQKEADIRHHAWG